MVRERRRARNDEEAFEQGAMAVGAAIVFALLLHALTPSSGFFSHLPSGWLGLFPALLVFDRRTVFNKIIFGIVYLGIWLGISAFTNAVIQ